MDDESGDDNRAELNEEVSRDVTGEADGICRELIPETE